MAFDYVTAAAIVKGEVRHISDDALRSFVHAYKMTDDECERLKSDMTDLRSELAKRDAEIDLLKGMLLELEE